MEEFMKKVLLLSVFVASVTTVSFAKDDSKKKFDRDNHFMEQLTEAQKECVKDHNCQKPDFKGEKMMNKDEMKDYRECTKKAFEACGIEKPEKKKGDGEWKDKKKKN
jgi:hypothetical protein